jgi:hypothetical protein
MQDGQEEDPFHGQFEASARQQTLDDAADMQFVPEASEDQGRTDALASQGGRVTASVGGENHHGFGEFGAAPQEAVELATAPQLVESSDGGDDALPAATFFPAVLDDLQINVLAGSFLAEEHGGLEMGFRIATMRISTLLVARQ